MTTASPRSWLPTVAAVAAHPELWATAVLQVVRLAPARWWRHPPHLPVPPPGYLAFRLETMYGDGAPRPDPADVVAYLRWCRSLRRTLR